MSKSNSKLFLNQFNMWEKSKAPNPHQLVAIDTRQVEAHWERIHQIEKSAEANKCIRALVFLLDKEESSPLEAKWSVVDRANLWAVVNGSAMDKAKSSMVVKPYGLATPPQVESSEDLSREQESSTKIEEIWPFFANK